jgi:hypothetical protein
MEVALLLEAQQDISLRMNVDGRKVVVLWQDAPRSARP